MQILFLTENFPPEVNAIATRVYERACFWVEAGHSVTVLTCFPNFPQGRIYPGFRQHLYRIEQRDGMQIIRLPTFVASNEGFVRRTIDFMSFMISAIIASPFVRRPDVVVATSPQFFAAIGGWIVSVIRWRPFVFELGDLWPASIVAVGAMGRGMIYRSLERLELFLYRRAAAVVALTQSFKDNLVQRGIALEKITVVINGVDLARYAPQARDPALEAELGLRDRFVVGYIGTHGMAHALENVLRAAALLRGRCDISFLFVGDGAARAKLVRQAGEEELDNVLFVPSQPKERIPRYWSLCDVALIHLKNDRVFSEVIPSKMFEAMAMGIPLLVASPAGEATRIVLKERAGIVVPPEEPRALALAIESLAGDVLRQGQLGAASLQAAPRYSRRRQAEEMISVLARVVEAHKANAAGGMAS